MKKIYTLILISTLGFYFASAQNAASNNCITIAAAGPDTTICPGNCVQLHASGGTKYAWSPGAWLNDTTTPNPVTCVFSTTTYTVTVTDSNCTPATATVTINVFPTPPTPLIFESNDTLFCRTDSSYFSYQWYRNDTLIPGATDTFLLVIDFCANYNVEVCTAPGCCIAVGINVILICTGINTLSDDKEFSLYPNPATNQLTIHASLHSDKAANVFITDVLGQETSPPFNLTPNPSPAGEGSATIDVSELPPGLYFVRVSDGRQSWAERFVKE